MAPMKTVITSQKERDRINLRLNPETFNLIDLARKLRPGVVSRNTWISEAIQEKLERDLDGESSETKQDIKNA